MRKVRLLPFLLLTLSLSRLMSAALMTSPAGAAERTLASEELSRMLVVEGIEDQGGRVSGRLVNKSENLIRNVKLVIQYSWRWKNERRPGTDNFSFAVDYVLPEAINPGQSAAFTYQPPSPPPSRLDGYFQVEVTIASFTRELVGKE